MNGCSFIVPQREEGGEGEEGEGSAEHELLQGKCHWKGS